MMGENPESDISDTASTVCSSECGSEVGSRQDKRGFVDFNLSTVDLHKPFQSAIDRFPTLDVLGWSRECSYRYQEPVTSISEPYHKYITETGVAKVPCSPSVFLEEFKPPSQDDLDTHISNVGRCQVPRPDGRVGQAYNRIRDEIRSMLSNGSCERDLLNPNRIFDIKIDGRRSAGLQYKKNGYQNKGAAIIRACRRAREKLQEMSITGSLPPQLFQSMGARGKVVSIVDAPKPKDGRLILIPDIEDHLITTLISKPAYRSIHRSKDGTARCCSMLGAGPFGSCMQDFVQRLQHKPFVEWMLDIFLAKARRNSDLPPDICDGVVASTLEYLMADVSGFDQGIQAWDLADSIDDMCDTLHLTDNPTYAQAYKDYLYREVIHTVIVNPEGYVLRTPSGVASGSPLTSVLDTLSCMKMWATCFLYLGIPARTFSFGDDMVGMMVCDVTLNATNGEQLRYYFDTSDIIKRTSKFCKEQFGQVLKPSQTYTTKNITQQPPVNKEESVSFLSLWFRDVGVPFPERDAIIGHLFHPEKNPACGRQEHHGRATHEDTVNKKWNDDGSIAWEIARTTAMYILSWSDPELADHIKGYYMWLQELNPLKQLTLREIADLWKLYDLPWNRYRPEFLLRLPNDIELAGMYGGLNRAEIIELGLNDQ
jgi:hypothetical protein